MTNQLKKLFLCFTGIKTPRKLSNSIRITPEINVIRSQLGQTSHKTRIVIKVPDRCSKINRHERKSQTEETSTNDSSKNSITQLQFNNFSFHFII